MHVELVVKSQLKHAHKHLHKLLSKCATGSDNQSCFKSVDHGVDVDCLAIVCPFLFITRQNLKEFTDIALKDLLEPFGSFMRSRLAHYLNERLSFFTIVVLPNLNMQF